MIFNISYLPTYLPGKWYIGLGCLGASKVAHIWTLFSLYFSRKEAKFLTTSLDCVYCLQDSMLIEGLGIAKMAESGINFKPQISPSL